MNLQVMPMDEHHQFYAYIAEYVGKHPECAAHVSDYVHSGILKALDSSNRRAADMEVALCVALSKRFKNGDELIRQKLDNWKGKTACNWDWIPNKPKSESTGDSNG